MYTPQNLNTHVKLSQSSRGTSSLQVEYMYSFKKHIKDFDFLIVVNEISTYHAGFIMFE